MASRHTSRILRSLGSTSRGYRSYASASTTARPSLVPVAAAVVLVGGGLWAVSQNEDLREALKSSFVAHADASARPDASAAKADAFRVDSATDTPFPTTLSLTTQSPLLTLVGLGVRTVSFLRVKVYSAGFYLEDAATKNLINVPGWHTFTAQHLLTPPQKATDPLEAPKLSGEELMRALLDTPFACAVRIVPVRNTDFGHLRDGFTRAIAARQKLARANGKLAEADDERIAASTQSLKAMFPAQSVPKGNALTLLRSADGTLTVEYEGKVLGQVNDPWVSRELMLAYFADKDAISAKLKEDVAHGLQGFTRK